MEMNRFGDISEPTPVTQVPYERPLTYPVYQFTPPDVREAYREHAIIPLDRPNLPPLLPYTPQPSMPPPPMPGPKYVQGPITKIIPSPAAPYPPQKIVSDHVLLKILVCKNVHLALKTQGLVTVPMRQMELDPNTKRLVIEDAYARTMYDVAQVQQGAYTRVFGGGTAWQYEAIRYNLLDASELRNVMSKVVRIQSSLEKIGG